MKCCNKNTKFTYTKMYSSVWIPTHAQTQIDACMDLHTHTRVRAHTHMHAHIYIHTYIQTHVYKHTDRHIHPYTQTHACIHTHTHACMHPNMCTCIHTFWNMHTVEIKPQYYNASVYCNIYLLQYNTRWSINSINKWPVCICMCICSHTARKIHCQNNASFV